MNPRAPEPIPLNPNGLTREQLVAFVREAREQLAAARQQIEGLDETGQTALAEANEARIAFNKIAEELAAARQERDEMLAREGDTLGSWWDEHGHPCACRWTGDPHDGGPNPVRRVIQCGEHAIVERELAAARAERDRLISDAEKIAADVRLDAERIRAGLEGPKDREAACFQTGRIDAAERIERSIFMLRDGALATGGQPPEETK